VKIRFYPKVSVVKSILQRAIAQEEEAIKASRDKIEAIENSRVYTGESKHKYITVISMAEESLKTLNDQLETLNSHEPPEVMAEIEI